MLNLDYRQKYTPIFILDIYGLKEKYKMKT